MMNGFLEILGVLLAAAGVLALGWFWFGRLVTPLPAGRAHAVVSACGSGGDLERTVRGLLWMQSSGASCGGIVIADLGLDAEGRAIAQRIAEEHIDVLLCAPGDLEALLRSDYWEEE